MKPNIDPAVFRDKIVFVGITASGLFDVFETPFSHGKMPGIKIHAAVADDILSNRFMRPASTASASRPSWPPAWLVGIVGHRRAGVVGDGGDALVVRRAVRVGGHARSSPAATG